MLGRLGHTSSGISVPESKNKWAEAKLDLRNKEIIILKQACTQCGKLVNADAENSETSDSPDSYCRCLKQSDGTENTSEPKLAASQSPEGVRHEVDKNAGTVTDLGATKLLGDQHEANTNVAGHSLAVDQVVANRYKIIEAIGRGGMGTVYAVQDLFLKRKAALKLLHQEFAFKPVIVQRFHKEVEAIAKLSHESIVKVHDLGLTESGAPFMVMDFVEGQGLETILKEKGHLSSAESLEIFAQIADAVGHAHARGVIHRDLKPSNVILCKDSQGRQTVRLVDFGIAKLIEPEDTQSKLTQTGDVFGSPQYMSPEQCRGEELDQRADIYSLGCILFEMVAGEMAFSAENAVKTILKHLNETRAEINKAYSVPPSVVAIIDHCLEKEKGNRYANCAELLKDVEIAKEGKRVNRKMVRQKVVSLPSVLAVSAIVLALTSGLVYMQNKSASPSEQSTQTGSVGMFWHRLDNEGQTALNKGDLDTAATKFSAASTFPSATPAQHFRSLRKLALTANLKNNPQEEANFDRKAEQVRASLSGDSSAAKTALKQSLLLMPEKINGRQKEAFLQLLEQINVVAQEELRKGKIDESLELLDLALNKLKGNPTLSEQMLVKLTSSRSAAFFDDKQYGRALENARLVNAKLSKTATAKEKAEAALLLAQCLAATGEYKQAAPIDHKALATALALPATEAGTLAARCKFTLGALLLEEGKPDEASTLFNEAMTNPQAIESLLPLVRWQLDSAVQTPDIFEKLVKKVLDDKSLTVDPKVRASYLTFLGDLYYSQPVQSGKQANAAPFYKEALDIRQSELSPNDKPVRESIKRSVALLKFLGQTGKTAPGEAEAIPLIKQWIAQIKRDAPQTNTELAQAYSYLAQILIKNGDNDGGKQAFQKMFEVTIQAPLDKIPFDEFFFSYANQFLSKADYKRIEPYLEKRAKKAEKENNLPLLWEAKDDLGHFYFRQGKTAEAGAQIKAAATSILSSQIYSLTPAVRWQAAQTIDNYAMYLRQQGAPSWDTYRKEAARMRYGKSHGKQ
ncbi:MAG: hypothetical protein C0469_18460 [Cyanobacteria bacterium DS2.3.42]|nr:hypothetical protein [Cyanobacteria bacterium DS2.3.42]